MSTPSARSPAGVIYGTAYLGAIDKAESQDIFDNILPKYGVTMLDTARKYEGSEAIIRELDPAKKYRITTKALPRQCGKEDILKSAKGSLEDLKVDKVEVYLLHLPDENTPIEETLEAIQELYLQGRFEKFGVSNFTTDMFLELYNAAKAKGYVLPTVYQSQYNILMRRNEERLFPTLRSLGVSIQAFSPLAGGFLTKTPEDFTNPQSDKLKGTRWDLSKPEGKLWHSIYNKPGLLEYLRRFRKLSEETGLSRSEIAGRWLRYHSELSGEKGDVLIPGGRTKEQVEDILRGLEKGPLDDAVVKQLDEMYQDAKGDVTFSGN